MIQIPQNLKSENFIIEALVPPEKNKNKVMKPKLTINCYTIAQIRNLFCIEYKTIFKRDFRITKESEILLYTIICYFFRDDRFFNSPFLIKPDGTNASFEKGLLIMGNCGVGKTSILLALEEVFKQHVIYNKHVHFKSITANEVVIEYEKIKTAEEKEDFYLKNQRGFKFYDDVKSEDVASNFGKVNLFEKILFLRDSKGSKTIITCNFDPSFPDDFDKGLDQFGIKYGGHIYDRILNNFNLVQGNGKSFRG